MKAHTMFGAMALAAIAGAMPAAAATIDTSGSYVARIDYFGARYAPAYGQTFTVGSATALNGLTFYLGGGAADVRAYVYSWGGHGLLGPTLYSSGATSFAGTTGDAFDALRFDVGALNLIAGQKYVAFLTTAGVPQPSNAGVAWMPTAGGFGSDAYAGGDFVYTSDSNVFGQAWADTNGVFGDVQFKADFSAGAPGGAGVPEPAAWAMLIGGFGFAGGALRRRRSRVRLRFV